MVVNKIGMAHLEIGKNCQDYGVETERTKIVCDGCSAGKHTEVGAKAVSYTHLNYNLSYIDIKNKYYFYLVYLFPYLVHIFFIYN